MPTFLALGCVSIVGGALLALPHWRPSLVSSDTPIASVRQYVQSIPIEFDPAGKVNCLILDQEATCRELIDRFVREFDYPFTTDMFQHLQDTARIRRMMVSTQRFQLFGRWESVNRSRAVVEPPRDREVTRTLFEALPSQQDMRFLLESELSLIYRVGKLFAIVRENAEVVRELRFWQLYLSREIPRPHHVLETTLTAIVTSRLFAESCASPQFAPRLINSAALFIACATRQWGSISAVTTSTNRFQVRDKFWSVLYPSTPGSFSRAVAIVPVEFEPLRKSLCVSENRASCVSLLADFSHVMNLGVSDGDDRMHPPAELHAFEMAVSLVNFSEYRDFLSQVDLGRLREVAGRANISVDVEPIWMQAPSHIIRSEAHAVRDFAFFFDFVLTRKYLNLRSWEKFWNSVFTSLTVRDLQVRMEAFIKAATVSDNLRGAIEELCDTDEAQAVMQGATGTRRMRLRQICSELPRSLNVVNEILEISEADLREIRRQWWSYEALLGILRPFFEYRVNGVRYTVSVIRFEGGRITFVSPVAPPRESVSLTEWSVTRGEGEDIEGCPVCHEEVPVGTDYVRLPCDHTCCRDCMQRWVDVSAAPNCPLCRNPLTGGRNVRQRLG